MTVIDDARAMFEATTMDTPAILRSLMDEWLGSPEWTMMETGKRYYDGDNDIRKRQQFRYEDDKPVLDTEKVNNRIAHPFMRLAVDEKVSYLLGESPVYELTKGSSDPLNEVLDEAFDDTLIDVAAEASNAGIGWLHGFIGEDADGKPALEWMSVPAEQVIPVWLDEAHTRLQMVVRFFYLTEYVGAERRQVLKVEVWDKVGVTYYTEVDGALLLDIEKMGEAEQLGHYTKGGKEESFGVIPFIPFKNNSGELPDLFTVKTLVDEYDKSVSDTANTLEEIQDFIYVLKNYTGTSLGEFVKNLRYYKAVKVEDDGGVEKLNADLNPTAIEAHLDRLKSDFYQFGQSVDMSTDKFGANPSGVALEFLYSGLKLKANTMERKFKRAFGHVFELVAAYLKATGGAAFDPKDAKVTFNRSIITNEKETIEAVNESTATISTETALANHPWVDDVKAEMKRIEQEKAASSAANGFNTVPTHQPVPPMNPDGTPKTPEQLAQEKAAADAAAAKGGATPPPPTKGAQGGSQGAQ